MTQTGHECAGSSTRRKGHRRGQIQVPHSRCPHSSNNTQSAAIADNHQIEWVAILQTGADMDELHEAE